MPTTGRPKKEKAEKASESIFIRLTIADYEEFKNIASSRKRSVSSLIITLLAEKESFAKKISEEEYIQLLERPEMLQNVSQNIRKENRRIIACWMTKEEKKSLTYQAVIEKNCSPTILINNAVMECIKNFTVQK